MGLIRGPLHYCASLSRIYLKVCAKSLGKDLSDLTKSDIPEISLIIQARLLNVLGIDRMGALANDLDALHSI